MSLDTVENRSSGLSEHKPQDDDSALGLMTPARRAALEALERELQELLKARPR